MILSNAAVEPNQLKIHVHHHTNNSGITYKFFMGTAMLLFPMTPIIATCPKNALCHFIRDRSRTAGEFTAALHRLIRFTETKHAAVPYKCANVSEHTHARMTLVLTREIYLCIHTYFVKYADTDLRIIDKYAIMNNIIDQHNTYTVLYSHNSHANADCKQDWRNILYPTMSNLYAFIHKLLNSAKPSDVKNHPHLANMMIEWDTDDTDGADV